jgi:hypothetical protein
MSLSNQLSNLLQNMIERIARFWIRILLQLNWRAVSDDSLPVISSPGNFEAFYRLDFEAKIANYRGMVEEMKTYGISFRELGIDPLVFWETLKKLGNEVRAEIERAFRANYFGKRIIDFYMGTLGVALTFLHEQASFVTVVPCPIEED